MEQKSKDQNALQIKAGRLLELARSGNAKSAARKAEKLVQQHPNNSFCWQLLAKFQVESGALDQARGTLARARARHPADKQLATLDAQARMLGAGLNAARKNTRAHPDDPEALATLSSMLPHVGDHAGSRRAARRAVSIQPVWPLNEASRKSRLRVLVTTALGQSGFTFIPDPKAIEAFANNQDARRVRGQRYPGDANLGRNNWHHTLDSRYISKAEIFVDAGRLDTPLPAPWNKADIIYNSLSDADNTELLDQVEALSKRLSIPVINPPNAVRKTARDANAARLAHAGEVYFPKTFRVQSKRGRLSKTVAETIRDQALQFPLIIRKPGLQNGTAAWLLRDRSALDNLPFDKDSTEVFIIEFHDTSDPKGFWKYRAFLVDGQLYPATVMLSKHWCVHRSTVATDSMTRRMIEERETRFNQSPEAIAGERGWDVLREAVAATGLDFCGMDFGISRDGKPVIFEINPMMRNELGSLKHRGITSECFWPPAVAFNRMFAARAGVEGMDLEPPARPTPP